MFRHHRHRLVLLALGLALTASACGSSGSSDASSASDETPSTGQQAAARFLEQYVTSDGRVLRHDQGADIVSEGQAYGMLIAEVAGRQDLVTTIWDWTQANLQRGDDLLAFHADAHGKILDQSSASDADVLAAYALLRYNGDDAERLHADGRALASAVLDHEATNDDRAGLVLVAGDWATTSPAVVNPSYWMPTVFDELAHLTDDPRWSEIATTTIDLVDQLTQSGSMLPPDWGQTHQQRSRSNRRSWRLARGAVRTRRPAGADLVRRRLLIPSARLGRFLVAPAPT